MPADITIIINKPGLTVETVNELPTDTTALDALKAQVAALTAEKGALQSKIDAAKVAAAKAAAADATEDAARAEILTALG